MDWSNPESQEDGETRGWQGAGNRSGGASEIQPHTCSKPLESACMASLQELPCTENQGTGWGGHPSSHTWSLLVLPQVPKLEKTEFSGQSQTTSLTLAVLLWHDVTATAVQP